MTTSDRFCVVDHAASIQTMCKQLLLVKVIKYKLYIYVNTIILKQLGFSWLQSKQEVRCRLNINKGNSRIHCSEINQRVLFGKTKHLTEEKYPWK